jgi:hypothetical protein
MLTLLHKVPISVWLEAVSSSRVHNGRARKRAATQLVGQALEMDDTEALETDSALTARIKGPPPPRRPARSRDLTIVMDEDSLLSMRTHIGFLMMTLRSSA